MKVPRYFVLVMGLLFALNAFAWWDVGHKLVAKIAYDKLTPAAKIQADELTRLLARDYPELTQFSDIAVWPDNLRKQSIDAYTHWHYIDNPYSSDGSVSQVVVDTDNAVWAMRQMQPVVGNSAVTALERARFLAFIVHVVGDLHQPLHTIARSSSLLPEGDLGGNLFFVKDPNNEQRTTNLHSLWDSNLGVFAGMDDAGINQLVTEITTRYPEHFFEQRSSELDPAHWAKGGYKIAVELVYATKENQVPTLEYQQHSHEVIEQ